MRVVYLASKDTLPGSPERRGDGFEHDQMMAALRPAFAARGVRLEDHRWDDDAISWADFDAAIIGTTWDYQDRAKEFLDRLDRIASGTRLFNDAGLARWNAHKRYLGDLEARGARLIPTRWLDRATPERIAAAMDDLETDDLVLKRQIGAGAQGQLRLRRGQPLPCPPTPMMAQPFLPAIESEGELSFVFVDGELSHALVKRAAPGDYRIQSMYGGREQAIQPNEADAAAARAVLDTLHEVPLYARVDMVRGADGRLLLMELELIEPFLYPLQGPDLGERLAAALLTRLDGRATRPRTR